MKTFKGTTLNIEFSVGFENNSNNAGPQYEDDWGNKQRDSIPSYWAGEGRIFDKAGEKSVIFTLRLSNKLPEECCGSMTHGEKVYAISESKLGFTESLFRFLDWQEGDVFANETEFNEILAKSILKKLDVEILPQPKFPLPHLGGLIWLDIKPLLDSGIVTRPNYQMEMLTDSGKA